MNEQQQIRDLADAKDRLIEALQAEVEELEDTIWSLRSELDRLVEGYDA